MDETGEVQEPLQTSTTNAEVTPVNIPEMRISTLAPTDRLTEDARATLNAQWRRFWELRQKPTEPFTGNVAQIERGFLIHNLRYDPKVIRTVFESGILSGELGYDTKSLIPEDSETNFCADFFEYVGEGATTIGDYFVRAQTPEAVGMLRKKPMESYSSPSSHEQQIPDGKGGIFQGRDNMNISLIVDPSRPELTELMHFSSNGARFSQNADNDPLKPFITQFPHESDIHTAVLVGVPANFIRAVVVGGLIESNKESLIQIKDAMAAAGLDIPVLNAVGSTVS